MNNLLAGDLSGLQRARLELNEDKDAPATGHGRRIECTFPTVNILWGGDDACLSKDIPKSVSCVKMAEWGWNG